jgi:hypothetical protein
MWHPIYMTLQKMPLSTDGLIYQSKMYYYEHSLLPFNK